MNTEPRDRTGHDRILPNTTESIQLAAAALNRGELVGMPTETVYGLAARADNEAAIARVFAAKQRPNDHPLIVHIAEIDDLDRWAQAIPVATWPVINHYWPGPLTLVFQAQASVPAAITGGQTTVAVRLPGHPVARGLITASGGALVAPSANRFGRISPTRAEHVLAELGDSVRYIIDGGECDRGIESTIIDFSWEKPRILRPGMITTTQLAECVELDDADIATDKPRVSGSHSSHYAPRTPARIVSHDALQHACENAPSAAILRVGKPSSQTRNQWYLGDSPEQYAHHLYHCLREADASAATLILIEQPPQTAAWAGINDRIQRACAAQ
jgi:L-threonylcarbamoyladenylate synthase